MSIRPFSFIIFAASTWAVLASYSAPADESCTPGAAHRRFAREPGTLQVEISNEMPGKPHIRVSIVNRSTVPLAIIRPSPKHLERYGSWGHWTIDVSGGQGTWQPFVYPAAIIPPDVRDCTVLFAGERMQVALDLGNFVDRQDERRRRLADTAGSYTVKVSYRVTPAQVRIPTRSEHDEQAAHFVAIDSVGATAEHVVNVISAPED